MSKLQGLIIVKFQRRWKTNRQIVAQSVLGERSAVAVDNLSARCRNIEDVSAREFLRLESRDNFLIESRFRRSSRGGGAGGWANHEAQAAAILFRRTRAGPCRRR